MGSVTADLLHKRGARIVGISDLSGAYYNPDGLDISAALAHNIQYGSLKGFTEAETLTNDEMLELPCTVLIPAAVEDVIRRDNASRIQAKIVCEAANGPTTAKADAILDEKGIVVVPDILANAGGVTVSYFEWVQNR